MIHRKQLPRLSLILCFFFLTLFAIQVSFAASTGSAQGNKGYHCIVVLGDPHLPGKYIKRKEAVITTINSWNDVDMVATVGDICVDRKRTSDGYRSAKELFDQLTTPRCRTEGSPHICPIAGNHDEDFESKQKKDPQNVLKDFKESFRLPKVYYSIKLEPYLLIFLSMDWLEKATETRPDRMISKIQLEWMQDTLRANKSLPTIVFFHAPLNGTFVKPNSFLGTDFRDSRAAYAQPEKDIQKIIQDNPQIFLWVSGHLHTLARDEDYDSSINVFEGRVTNIHNADMERNIIWTNSLYLHPKKVVIKTIEHKPEGWTKIKEREVPVPSPKQSP
jgi:3',5'-cyclic-AMP phosphodiesterase